jgi:hypothetical protein
VIRRGAIAATLAVIAAAAAGLPGPGGASGPAPALAADCVPVQHAKTVVKRKKVRRAGKLVKVKRRKVIRWTTCEPPAPPPASCAEPASALGVIARDSAGFEFTLSRPCVSAGSVAVELDNRGEDAHALALRPAGPPAPPAHRVPGPYPAEVEPGLQAGADLELSAGDWYLWCDLPGHEQAGMNATLAVR